MNWINGFMDCLSSGLQNGKVRKGSQENIFQHVFLPWIVTGKILCSVATAGKPGYTQNNFRQKMDMVRNSR